MCTQKHCSKSDYFTHSQHVVSSTFTSVFLCCLLLPCCMTNASAANSPPIQSINSDIFSQVVATYWRLVGGPTWWPSVFIVNNKRKPLCFLHFIKIFLIRKLNSLIFSTFAKIIANLLCRSDKSALLLSLVSCFCWVLKTPAQMSNVALKTLLQSYSFTTTQCSRKPWAITTVDVSKCLFFIAVSWTNRSCCLSQFRLHTQHHHPLAIISC